MSDTIDSGTRVEIVDLTAGLRANDEFTHAVGDKAVVTAGPHPKGPEYCLMFNDDTEDRWWLHPDTFEVVDDE